MVPHALQRVGRRSRDYTCYLLKAEMCSQQQKKEEKHCNQKNELSKEEKKESKESTQGQGVDTSTAFLTNSPRTVATVVGPARSVYLNRHEVHTSLHTHIHSSLSEGIHWSSFRPICRLFTLRQMVHILGTSAACLAALYHSNPAPALLPDLQGCMVCVKFATSPTHTEITRSRLLVKVV